MINIGEYSLSLIIIIISGVSSGSQVFLTYIIKFLVTAPRANWNNRYYYYYYCCCCYYAECFTVIKCSLVAGHVPSTYYWFDLSHVTLLGILAVPKRYTFCSSSSYLTMTSTSNQFLRLVGISKAQ